MNKALHVLVYVFLVLAGAALFFEIQLNAKRAELTDRNRLQEDYLVKIARTIESADPGKDSMTINRDNSPVEAQIVDAPEMENLLDGYEAALEKANLDTYNWDNQRDKLRKVYVLDAEGKPYMDGNQPLIRGSDEYNMLETLFNGAKSQQSRLNSTRAALTELRGKLETVVNELNQLKNEDRQDKVTIEEQKAKIATLESEKADLEDQITRAKAQIDELNTEITSLKDEVAVAKDETEVAKEEIAKQQKLIDQLKEMVKKWAVKSRGDDAVVAGMTASLPAGDKGRIIEADNENMFAIVEFTKEAMQELKGEDLNQPLPMLELGVKRPGFNGEAGEFVGRIRLRQEVKGKCFVICDILGAWEQDKLSPNDVIFAD